MKNSILLLVLLFYRKHISYSFIFLMHSIEKVPFLYGMARPQAAGSGNDFGTWRDETGGCSRKLHNEELRNLYSLVNIVRIIMLVRMRRALPVALVRKGKSAYRDFVGKAEGEDN
jgi:hypothetical protein